MKHGLRRWVPTALTDRVRASDIAERRLAKRLASTSKRLDVCSAQFAMDLHLSACPPLAGRVCLEIGTGWVLTHALVCYLLGARRVVASDISPHAHPEALQAAVQQSVASIVRDVLAPFEEHSLVRRRLDRLLSIKSFDHEVLKDLGIEHVAPIDFAKDRLGRPVDFIFSNSVLEHVPSDDVRPLLRNVSADLSRDGFMLHNIHLEDHADVTGAPFGFLSLPDADYGRSLQSSRGNRIRKSVWQQYFAELPDTTSSLIYEWSRRDRPLPAHVDQSVRNEGPDDLRISHIGVYASRPKG